MAQARPPTYHNIEFPNGDSYGVTSVSRMTPNSRGEQNVLAGFGFRYVQDGQRNEFNVQVAYNGRVNITQLNPATGQYEPARVDRDLINSVIDIAEHPDVKAQGRMSDGTELSTAALRRGLLQQYPNEFPPERLNNSRVREGANTHPRRIAVASAAP